MLFNFSFKSSVLLIFSFHGFIFSALLLLKGLQRSNRSSIWLSAAIFLGTLYIFPFMCGYAGWYAKNPYRDILFYIPFQQLFLLPPVLYFYIKTLLDRSFVFSSKHLFHFIPATAYILYSLVVFVTDKLILKAYYFYSDGRDKDFSVWYQAAGFMVLFFYLLLSLKVYNRYKSISYQVVSFADEILFLWVKKFLLAFLLLLILRALFFILNPEWDKFGSKFWYYVCFSILFYYISISGYSNYLQTVIPFNDTGLFDQNVKVELPCYQPAKPELKTFAGTQEFELLKNRIGQVMIADQLFKNPELTLTDLSDKLGINSKRVSQVINQGYNLNFNDFVNYYRVEEVIKILQSDRPQLITLLGIALDSGFNSKSTFNRAFKKHTSITPRAYLGKFKISVKS